MPSKNCYQYAQKGSCSYGDGCKYRHVDTRAGRRNNAGTNKQHAPGPVSVQVPGPSSTPAAYTQSIPPPASKYDSDFDEEAEAEVESEFWTTWGAPSSPTTFAPYPHYSYSPNDYIAQEHPDFIYTPVNPVQYTADGKLALETPLDVFFASFNPRFTFTYNPYASVSDEFPRLCLECWGWDVTKKHTRHEWASQDGQEVSEAKKGYKRALVDQFKVIFGVEERSLRAWQTLYEALGVNPLPGNLEDCYEIIDGVFVNMVDVLDAVRIRRLGVDYQVPVFPTEEELSVYTKKHDRFFPLWAAKQSGLLKELLREILEPRASSDHPEPHSSLNLRRREMLNRLAVAKVQRMNARNLEVAMAGEALKRLRM